MEREGHNDIRFFIGTEVEHTPAFGKKTLFVVGIQSQELIEAAYIAHKCEHIYFGANQSFAPDGTAEYYTGWDNMVLHFLKKTLILLQILLHILD